MDSPPADLEAMRLMIEQLQLAKKEQQKQLQDQQIQLQDQQIRLQDTTLEELLEFCNDIYSTFTVQQIKAWTTGGSITSPEKKPCPKLLREWREFPYERHNAYQKLNTLLHSDNPLGSRIFMSKERLKGVGSIVPGKSIGSENNLKEFRQNAVENLLCYIVDILAKEDKYTEALGLKQELYFDDHSNTLNDAAVDVQAKKNAAKELTKPIWADRICCTIDEINARELIFVIEQKAPHKLTQRILEIGLCEMDIPEEIVNEVLIPQEQEAKLRHDAQGLVAAALSQAYGYMIQGGLEYGCVETGEATVFLRIDEKESNTLYYHLAIPSQEVKAIEGVPCAHELTALGQLLTFLLMALQSHRRDANWTAKAMSNAHIWLMDEEAILKKIPNEEYKPGTPHSSYKPSGKLEIKALPFTLRNRSCQDKQALDTENDEEDSQQDQSRDKHQTPTRKSGQAKGRGARGGKPSQGTSAPNYHNKHTPYCTHACLLGLVTGSNFDESCPNIVFHRRYPYRTKHLLALTSFCARVRRQLGKDLVGGLTNLHLHGARSNVFKVTLLSHGYTFIAKGTIDIFIPDLQHEAQVYKRLRPLQGTMIPVKLGNIELQKPWWDIGVCIVHMLLMSWAGEMVTTYEQQDNLNRIVGEMKKLGVEHADLGCQNMMWNRETERLMLIDFERSVMRPLTREKGLRKILMETTGNAERGKAKKASRSLKTVIEEVVTAAGA